MKPLRILSLLALFVTPAHAHFGTLIPSQEIVSQTDDATVSVELAFLHPLEGDYMEMKKPRHFGVFHDGQKTDLRHTLEMAKGHGESQEGEFTFWKSNFQVRRPGDYTFYMEPMPYWEPAENLFIVHYTKVCVNAFGLEQDWDRPIGLATEIIPLTRPYGLWTGNLFSGRVLLYGEPVAGAEVEIEYLNQYQSQHSRITPLSAPFVTQVVKTDSNGVFSYAMPKAGWWGFSALNSARESHKFKGISENRTIELGAVYWVRTQDLP